MKKSLHVAFVGLFALSMMGTASGLPICKFLVKAGVQTCSQATKACKTQCRKHFSNAPGCPGTCESSGQACKGSGEFSTPMCSMPNLRRE